MASSSEGDVGFELVPELSLDRKFLEKKNEREGIPFPRRIGSATSNFSSASSSISRRESRSVSGPASPAASFLSRVNSQLSASAAGSPIDATSKETTVGIYRLGRVLGVGGFSLVREAVAPGNKVFAVKIINKQNVSMNDVKHECDIWTQLDHPHILQLLEQQETTHSMYLFTESMSMGSLYDLLKRTRVRGQKPLKRFVEHMKELGEALDYLHNRMQVIHRDVKLENCLLHATRGVVLCDFGLSEYVSDVHPHEPEKLIGPAPTSTNLYAQSMSRRSSVSGRPSQSQQATRQGGSLPYAAPELLTEAGDGEEPISTALDVWAFGVAFYTLVTGKPPWSHPFPPRLRTLILSSDYDMDPVPEWARAVVKACLVKDREQRASIKQVLELIGECLPEIPETEADAVAFNFGNSGRGSMADVTIDTVSQGVPVKFTLSDAGELLAAKRRSRRLS